MDNITRRMKLEEELAKYSQESGRNLIDVKASYHRLHAYYLSQFRVNFLPADEKEEQLKKAHTYSIAMLGITK